MQKAKLVEIKSLKVSPHGLWRKLPAIKLSATTPTLSNGTTSRLYCLGTCTNPSRLKTTKPSSHSRATTIRFQGPASVDCALT